MFSQFQAQYPGGSCIAELIDIHAGKFIVRVLLSVEGTPLASGMAAAETVEQAEDRARERAFAAIGIVAAEASSSTRLTFPAPSFPTPVPRPSFDPAIAPVSPTISAWESGSSSTGSPATDPLPAPLPNPMRGDRPLAPKTTAPAPEASAPVDVSDTMAKIAVEMKRLNWTAEQARTYTDRTYGKRSSTEMSGMELQQFLDYLKSLPTPNLDSGSFDFP